MTNKARHPETMQADGEGFLYPVIDETACIACGACEHVCPIKNTSPEPAGEPDAYAAYNKNTEQRLESSSGGMFSLLAEEILQSDGGVFGATMSEDCRKVQHIAVERQEDLWKLRGSKYLQSEIGNTYRQAENALKQGRRVLFSGTPCEIEGLHSYLQRKYENLLCVDVICHGAPSAKLWKNMFPIEKIAQALLRSVRTSPIQGLIHADVLAEPLLKVILLRLCI